MKKLATMALVIVAQLNLAGCASVVGYWSRSITATVVDEETKRPVKGAVVVAVWELRRSSVVGVLNVAEAITDADGKFHIPGWGPKYAFFTGMTTDAPELIVFKPGYLYKVLMNDGSLVIFSDFEAIRSSEWNGKTIELPSATGDLARQHGNLSALRGDLGFLWHFDHCLWRRTPRMYVALHKASRELEKAGVVVNGLSRVFSISDMAVTKECGDPVEYLREYFDDEVRPHGSPPPAPDPRSRLMPGDEPPPPMKYSVQQPSVSMEGPGSRRDANSQ